jgi:hypothetical protein
MPTSSPVIASHRTYNHYHRRRPRHGTQETAAIVRVIERWITGAHVHGRTWTLEDGQGFQLMDTFTIFSGSE